MKNNVKEYTEKAAAVAVNKLLKDARKRSRRPVLYNTWTDAAGRCCCCDGFRAYRLNTAPAGIVEDETAKRAPAGYDLLDKAMTPEIKRAAVEIPAPDFAAVAAARKDKNNTAHVYDLGPGAPCVNIAYLHELLQLFPSARWYIDADAKKRYIAPVYVVCDEGDAVLMPLRVEYKFNEAAAAQEAPAASAQETPAPVYSFTADSITITAPGETPRTFPASFRITSAAAVEVKISGENAPAPVLLFKIGSPYFEAARNATLDAYDAAYNDRVQGVKAARAAAQDVPETGADETPAAVAQTVPAPAQAVQEAPAAPAQDAPEAVAAVPAPADEVPAVQDPETPETPAETEKPVENAPAAEAETAAETVEASNKAPAGAFAAFTAAARASYGALPAAPAAPAPAVPEKTFIGSRLVGPGYEIFFDAALQRTRVIFTAEPSAERVAAVTESGFYYSPSQNSYNKKLTFKAYRAALKLTEALDAIPA